VHIAVIRARRLTCNRHRLFLQLETHPEETHLEETHQEETNLEEINLEVIHQVETHPEVIHQVEIHPEETHPVEIMAIIHQISKHSQPAQRPRQRNHAF
jgi:hypothetical protein